MVSQALLKLLVPGTDPDVAAAYAAFSAAATDAVFGFEDEIAFVDIETTGFDPSKDRIIEVAAVVARGPEVLERFATLVDPGVPIPLETTRLTGIDDAMVRGHPHEGSACARLADVVAGRDIVAHNVSFDRAFLTRAAGASAFAGAWIDTLELARIAFPRLRSHRLRDLASAFGPASRPHRAQDDAEALARLWRVMLVALSAMPPEVVRTLSSLSPATDWPLRRLLAHMAAARASGPLDLRMLRKERVGPEPSERMLDAADAQTVCPEAASLLAEFSPEGVAGRMYADFEPRDEQAQMAEAVLGAFAEDRHVAIEAGTGVGKSVAYLLPAARFAMENRVGVGVATKTNSLTDQLVYGELPALAEALGGRLRFVSLKGYEHYPCLRKIERLAATDDLDRERLASVAMLLAWTAQTSWGDLGTLNLHWRRGLRPAVACSVADCTRKRCRYFRSLCFLHGARARADCAHVVVTNHALLFRDLVTGGGILPPLRHWVVDEAHAAESEARKQLSVVAGHAELAAALRALHAPGHGGLLAAVRSRVRARPGGDVAPLLRGLDETGAAVETATTLTASFFDFVKDLGELRPRTDYERTELRLTAKVRETSAWGTAAGVGRSLVRKLDAVLGHGRALVTGLEAAGEAFVDARADLAGALTRIAEQREALVSVIEAESDAFVYSATVDRRREVCAERLQASVLDVGATLAEEFYPDLRSVVFTSATIAAGDDFAHFARAMGLDRLPDGAWSPLRLPSSYDFDRQMAVFVPSDLAEPSSTRYLAQLEGLLEEVHSALGGSVLTLFTNRRDMDAVYRSLEPRLEHAGLPVLVQRDTVSAKRLRDEFVADERLSLFATRSFWEGFDAKGDTLRCVVVTKLPFGQIADPLLEERRERDRDWWEHYYLPEAVIELKQAAGRLIRSATDTGCLVIADTRVIGPKPYGRSFLRALPVSDVEVLPSAELVSELGRRFGRR